MQWEFYFYALSLPHGHGFGDEPAVVAWSADDGNGYDIVIKSSKDDSFCRYLLTPTDTGHSVLPPLQS